jgi:hypothetical protein
MVKRGSEVEVGADSGGFVGGKFDSLVVSQFEVRHEREIYP